VPERHLKLSVGSEANNVNGRLEGGGVLHEAGRARIDVTLARKSGAARVLDPEAESGGSHVETGLSENDKYIDSIFSDDYKPAPAIDADGGDQ
jgi:hypothetical protein